MKFLIEEGASFQHWYDRFKYDKEDFKSEIMAGKISRPLSSEEKLTTLRFCLKEIYTIKPYWDFMAITDPFEKHFVYHFVDHSLGHQYAEALIHDKITSTPIDDSRGVHGDGLLLTVLRQTPSIKLIKPLLEGRHQDNINQVNDQGITPLIAMVIKKNIEVLNYFLSASDIQVNYQNPDGNTALHYAVSIRSIESVKSLLSHKSIKPDLYNKFGHSPLSITQNPHIIELLIKAGAVPLQRNNQKDGNRVTIPEF